MAPRAAAPNLPSIARRLAWTLLLVAVASSLAASAAVWLAVRHEVRELLDDTLQGAAEAMRPHLQGVAADPAPGVERGRAGMPADDARYAWQVVEAQPDGTARVLQASDAAPATALCTAPCPGLHDRSGWRVFGLAVGEGGRMLYVAQSREEQVEATVEIVLAAALGTLAVGLLFHLWLRLRLQAELAPLVRLGERLERHDLLAPQATLGPAERAELAPVHRAIDALAAQLRLRLAHERAVSAHAAHALRTPLAGLDAQLAVAALDAPPTHRPRLARARAASARLQRVVTAVLALFQSGLSLRREPVRLDRLVDRLPVEGLAVHCPADAVVQADADLLAAALVNLLDNALRHGARSVHVSCVAPQVVAVCDDGPGVDPGRRAQLLEALHREALQLEAAFGDAPSTDRVEAPTAGTVLGRLDRQTGGAAQGQALGMGLGLGLALADRVARAHGGRLDLPASASGFVVHLALGEASAEAPAVLSSVLATVLPTLLPEAPPRPQGDAAAAPNRT